MSNTKEFRQMSRVAEETGGSDKERTRSSITRVTQPLVAAPSVALSATGVMQNHFTSWLSLKIGRMMLIAMKPTTEPIMTIISGSIMAVQPLITALSSRE